MALVAAEGAVDVEAFIRQGLPELGPYQAAAEGTAGGGDPYLIV